MTFHQYSKEILTEYLGTVAYVDDLIFSRREETKAADLKIDSPREMAAKTYKEMPLVERNAEEEVVERKPNTPIVQLVPNINPVTLTNAFLAKGIHCSLFEVENDEDSLDPLKSILKKSDVVILDWQMHQDDGRKARELLLSVIKNSQQPELRLYIIFTNDKKQYNNLLSQTILPELMKAGVIDEIPEDIECVFKFGHSKIVVLEKENGEKSETTVSDEELPDRIIEEFAEITSGLVSNTVLKSISVVRRNTHSLLAAFNKNLDAAYLAHRAMLSTPEDSESLLKSTIVDSFDSLLTYSQIHTACNIDQIEKWIDENDFPKEVPHIYIGKGGNKLDIEINKENKKKWLKAGWKKLIQDQPGNQITENQYESFEKDGPLFTVANSSFVFEGNTASQDFAILTHHKSNFTTPSYTPFLTLGVVVQNDDDYFLCIQQKCDSVRIEENETRNFLFLPLTQKGNFPIIFKNVNGEYLVKKASLNKCHHLSLIKFGQTKNGIVEALKEEGGFYFESFDHAKFKWILDLKDSHAQRIANKFAAELSRVGLDESEWLRRS